MYHEAGLRQADIAKKLGLSQSQVSRSLKAAAAAGYVRTVVVPPPGVHTHLEEAIREKFDLRDVIVADAEGWAAEVRSALGRSGAQYLEATIGAGECLGISSWSATLLAAVDEIPKSSPRPARAVVQIIGGVGAPTVQVHATRLTERLARLTGARPVFVSAPGVVISREARQALLQDHQIATAAAAWSRLDSLLLGIGAITPSSMIRASGNTLTRHELDELVAGGAVGDVSLRYFDREGREVATELTDRVLGISSDQLRTVPRRIGIAGGVEKREAIAAALRGGWVNVLLTDVGVARWLASDAVGGIRPIERFARS